MGYNDAVAAFGNNQLDAFWLFAAFPSSAVIMAAQTNDIELVDLAKDAEDSGFFKKYPYFAKLKKTFREMRVKDGTKGIVTPLHPGAQRFWKEKGL